MTEGSQPSVESVFQIRFPFLHDASHISLSPSMHDRKKKKSRPATLAHINDRVPCMQIKNLHARLSCPFPVCSLHFFYFSKIVFSLKPSSINTEITLMFEVL